MSASPNLKLPYIDANQNQKSVTHNEALRVLDALVNLHVASATLTAPPGSLNDGQCWIVAPGGSGAWLGKDLNVAAWQDGAWTFYAPNPGFVAYVDAIGGALMWNGSAWVSLLNVVTQLSLNTLGIGTAADPANPLSAKLNSALFAALPTTASPAGTGNLRVALSKQGSGNVASLLYQDNYSGRAEIGLVGDDNFHVKVSPDGSTFYDAMVVAASGGAASFLATPVHPSPAAGDNSTSSATTAWVTAKSYVTASGAAAAAPVQSVAGRIGTVTLAVGDVSGAAPLASPGFSGTPTAPNAAAGTNTAQIATTSFVAASFVTYAYAAATYATIASPTFTGTPSAPTPSASDNSTKLATTAFVAGTYAPLASPGFSGTPTAPNPTAGTNSTQIATTSFVAASFVTYAYASATYATLANATLTGTPTAPTQAQADNSTRIATTAYADRAASANFARTQVNDAAYTVLASDRTVAMIALTAARVLTLPAASAYPQGVTLTVVDESGACSATSTITLARAGSDTINGASSAVIASAFGYLALESNGSNKWTVIDQPSGSVSALNGGPLAGFRNRLVNGNFAVNQRAYASGTALSAGAYAHDRWKAGASGATYTFTTATPDTTITITAGTLLQVIEAANVEGGVYTLSWTGTAAARIYQGTASGAYVASPIVVTGLAGGTSTTVEFSTGTLGKMQFEPGSIATVFERRGPFELQLCQRYYAAFTAVLLAGYAGAGGAVYYDIFLPVTMRAIPTVAYANFVYSNMSGCGLNSAQASHVRSSATMTSAGSGYAQYDISMNAEL